MAWRDMAVPCMEVRNVTIIPHIVMDDNRLKLDDTFYIHKFSDTPLQLRYLVKSLLDTPCFIVWIFSPTRSRVIPLTEDNYIEFIMSEWQTVTRTDENELTKVLVNMPHNNVDNKQTLFFVYHASYGQALENYFKVITRLQDMYERKQVDIVQWSLTTSAIWKWLPKQNRIVEDRFKTPKFNRHFHRILMDLMKNPQYDWHGRYSQYAHIQCRTSKEINLYVWIDLLWSLYRNRITSYIFWNDIVKDLSFNETFYRIVTLTRNSAFLLHQYNLTRDQSTKLMKEEEGNDEIIVVHLPISYEKVNL